MIRVPLISQPEHYRHLLTRLVIGTIAVTQGLAGIADLAVAYLYKDDFVISPSSYALLMTVTNVALVFKPVWGFTSDSVPICGLRRMPYLLGFSLLSAVMWIALSNSYTLWLTVLLLTLNSVCTAFCNVIAEALVVEESQRQGGTQSQAAKNVSFFFILRALGYMLTSYLSGALIEYFSARTVLGVTAICPLILFSVAWVLPEDPVSHSNSISLSTQCKDLVSFVCRREMALPLGFIYVFVSTPSASDAMFFFYTNELGLSPEFIGRLRLANGIAMIAGMFAYRRWLKDVSFKCLFACSAVFYSLVSLSQVFLVTRTNAAIGIPDSWFLYCNGFLSVLLGELNLMPILVLCARICPKNVEGTLYAFFMSTMNLGYLTAASLSSLLMSLLGITQTHFEHLWLLIVICSFTLLLPLPILFKLEISVPESKANKEQQLMETELGAS
jgi:folate/biopterin transporter